ncbi:MAG: histidine kinase, partial [Deltaproteobacteria bacterium]|nr:histidine kinase [Candidatus Anaeroferrophillacea bacterium]
MKPQFVLLSAVMLLVFLCLPAAIVPPPVAASTDTACRAPSCRHNVLVLHSYHHGFSWDDEIDRGIVAGFDGSGRRSDIRFEYMDTKRHHDDTYRQRLLDLYRCKFAGDSFDVVITVDNNAFDFLRRQRDELFPGTPVVFCGVNNFQDDMLTGLEGFTGVVEKVDIRSTLSAAVRLHPETARVVVYGDGSPTYRANRDLLEQVIPDHVTTRKFEFFERPGLQIDAVRAHVRDLSANSLILLITTVRDHNGRLLSFEDSAALIAAAGTVPVYGCWDFFLGHGIVGGML